MVLYEYRAIEMDKGSGVSLEFLNKQGEEGWLLCAVLLPYVIFVKEKVGESVEFEELVDGH